MPVLLLQYIYIYIYILCISINNKVFMCTLVIILPKNQVMGSQKKNCCRIDDYFNNCRTPCYCRALKWVNELFWAMTERFRSFSPGHGRFLWTAGRLEPSAGRAASSPQRCDTPASSASEHGRTPPPSATGPPPADAADTKIRFSRPHKQGLEQCQAVQV